MVKKKVVRRKQTPSFSEAEIIQGIKNLPDMEEWNVGTYLKDLTEFVSKGCDELAAYKIELAGGPTRIPVVVLVGGVNKTHAYKQVCSVVALPELLRFFTWMCKYLTFTEDDDLGKLVVQINKKINQYKTKELPTQTQEDHDAYIDEILSRGKPKRRILRRKK